MRQFKILKNFKCFNFKFYCRQRHQTARAIEHVGPHAGPPSGDAVEEVDVVFAEGDEVVAGEDTT